MYINLIQSVSLTIGDQQVYLYMASPTELQSTENYRYDHLQKPKESKLMDHHHFKIKQNDHQNTLLDRHLLTALPLLHHKDLGRLIDLTLMRRTFLDLHFENQSIQGTHLFLILRVFSKDPFLPLTIHHMPNIILVRSC